MKQVTAITDDAFQEFSITLDDGTIVNMTMNYIPGSPNGYWLYSASYPTTGWEVLNQILVNSPNLLRKYRNIIPFGFCVPTIDGYEIVNISDFVSGRASFYVLNPADLILTETLITQTLPAVNGYQLQ